ncbi:MAG: NAD-dependent epimerase/dehydratase family protein [Planctomycetota bacterium]|jgi:dihydroflavonol-4-reductase
MPNVFMTGATGFVGASLAPLLHDAGHKLRCLVRQGSDTQNLQGVPFERVVGSLDDEAVLREALRGTDIVVHLAALVSFCKPDTAHMWQVNVRGTEVLARLAREAGVGRFLHMSSVGAIGATTAPFVLNENSSYEIKRYRLPYCDTKRSGEQAVLAEVSRGLDAVIVNPASMFGPGDRRKTRSSLLNIAAKSRIPFSPPGGLCMADVRDVARGTMSALEKGRTGERYILGGQNLHGREMVAAVMEAAGRLPPRLTLHRYIVNCLAAAARVVEAFKPLPPPMTAQMLRMWPLFFWYSSAKAEAELGYSARPIRDALQGTYRWMELEGLLVRPRAANEPKASA